ncbi:MAG: protein translocase subunit SecF [Chloroflexi bacterium]|nr:protein translocase subunit SecF [Chloroflexota bacterium]
MTAALNELGKTEVLVVALDDGYLRIRTEPIDLIPAPTPTPIPTATPVPTPSPTATPAPSSTPEASGGASASADASASAVPSPSASASPSPSPTPPPVAEGTEFADLHAALQERFGPGEPRSVRTVGPVIGADLIRSSIILIAIGELFILGYLWIRFGFRFGTAAIIALLHDVIVVVGTFAILGFFFNYEFDALFVTALLTVIGFSVHDTIVVFDRIRENRVRHSSESFGAIVNHSILQTVGRSIITSLTVAVPLLALLLLGPPTIGTFSLALLIGILAGAYSSIFNASQILVTWTEWEASRKVSRSR